MLAWRNALICSPQSCLWYSIWPIPDDDDCLSLGWLPWWQTNDAIGSDPQISQDTQKIWWDHIQVVTKTLPKHYSSSDTKKIMLMPHDEAALWQLIYYDNCFDFWGRYVLDSITRSLQVLRYGTRLALNSPLLWTPKKYCNIFSIGSVVRILPSVEMNFYKWCYS